MAVATATAIAAGASLVGSGLSFARAAQERRNFLEAGEVAAKAVEEARKKYETKFTEQLQVPLEGYRAAAEANAASASQVLEAMRESGQRSIIGGVAGLQQQVQQGSEDMRLAMQQDLYNRDLMIAEEEAGIRDRLAGLDLQEATGAQQAAADAQNRMASAIESGIGGIAQAGSTIFEGSQLYNQTQGAKMADKFGQGLTGTQKGNLADKFSNLSRGQMNFLKNQDPRTYSPFLQTPANLAQAQQTALTGIKGRSLGQLPLPKINFPK